MTNGTGNGERIEQGHRIAAAAALKGDDAKTAQVRASILAGTSDAHPMVQAAAFYGEKGLPASVDELLAADPQARAGMWPDSIPGLYALVTAMTSRVQDVETARAVVALANDLPEDAPARQDLLLLLRSGVVSRLDAKGVDAGQIAEIFPLADAR